MAKANETSARAGNSKDKTVKDNFRSSDRQWTRRDKIDEIFGDEGDLDVIGGQTKSGCSTRKKKKLFKFVQLVVVEDENGTESFF